MNLNKTLAACSFLIYIFTFSLMMFLNVPWLIVALVSIFCGIFSYAIVYEIITPSKSDVKIVTAAHQFLESSNVWYGCINGHVCTPPKMSKNEALEAAENIAQTMRDGDR